MVALAAATSEGKVAYIAPTYQQARDIAWAELKRICDPVAHTINESRLEITLPNIKGNESKIVLRGWESVETLRGQKFHFLVIDEIAMMRTFWAEWQEVLRPTLTDYKGQAMFISTPKGFNHFYDLYNLETRDSDYKSFHFTSYDNPYLPKEEIDKAKEELTEDRFAQEYLADFRKTEGLVYKEFDRSRHLFTELPEIAFLDTIAGVDFGFTNPCAVVTIRKDYDSNYWITEEWYKKGQTENQIAEFVASKRFSRVYPDPESASGIREFENKGINVREVLKNKDSIKSGISTICELFKANRLHIQRDCVNLILELETYSYPERKPLHNEDENPIKENDHAMDAMRYALWMDSMAVKSDKPNIAFSDIRTYGMTSIQPTSPNTGFQTGFTNIKRYGR